MTDRCRRPADQGETVPFGDGLFNFTSREPAGVVGAMTPWNAPVQLAVVRIAAALATGNTVVVKVSKEAPLAVLAVARILGRYLPPGVLNIVTGYGHEADAGLLAERRIGKLSRTMALPAPLAFGAALVGGALGGILFVFLARPAAGVVLAAFRAYGRNGNGRPVPRPGKFLHRFSTRRRRPLHARAGHWAQSLERKAGRKDEPPMLGNTRNPLLGRSMPLLDPVSAAWNTVARFDDYESVQRAVDRLSDDGFPVENLDVVGSDLRLVERVTGRLTKARAAGAGALSGFWVGLLIGLLIGLFASGHSMFAVVAVVAVFGAAWGAVFGYATHAATRGRRDFSSVRTLAAGSYDLIARGGTVQSARSSLIDAGLLPAEPAIA